MDLLFSVSRPSNHLNCTFREKPLCLSVPFLLNHVIDIVVMSTNLLADITLGNAHLPSVVTPLCVLRGFPNLKFW